MPGTLFKPQKVQVKNIHQKTLYYKRPARYRSCYTKITRFERITSDCGYCFLVLRPWDAWSQAACGGTPYEKTRQDAIKHAKKYGEI
jgi:hypothetical protein